MGERAPLWDSNMRGMYIGANVATTQADMLRAVYEGTSFALKEICEEVKKTGVTIPALPRRGRLRGKRRLAQNQGGRR